MKKICMICAAIALPVSVFADVNFHLSIGSAVEQYEHTTDVEYIDDGEPWFEECEGNGNKRLSFEYQWSIYGSGHVLRYRQITFHTINNSWAFGPWIIKEKCCHPSCRAHHNHVYHHHVSHPNWHRVYNREKHVYHYEYKCHPSHSRHGHYTVYRHEYRPPEKHIKHVNQKQHRNYNYKKTEKHHYTKPQNSTNHKSSHMKKQSTSHNNKHHVNKPSKRSSMEKKQNNSKNKITRVYGRQ